jgi:hypothetical protein
VSVKRSIARTVRKKREFLRRQALKNGRVKRRTTRRSARRDAQEVDEAIAIVQSVDETVFVPPTSPTALRIVWDAHLETGHGSVRAVEADLARKWLIPQMQRLYKYIRRKRCAHCQVNDPKPFKLPEGDLLEERVEAQRPFEVVGLDFVGPLDVLEQDEDSEDRVPRPSICIFTCPYTRAVSLQACEDQCYDSFVAAYDTFRYTRDVRPLKIRSDNALVFQQAANQEAIRAQIHETRWDFNPPQASWWGGFYERLIKMIKQKLALCFCRQKFEGMREFRVAVAYLEWILNNRPVYVSKGSGDGEFLTVRPGQFINHGHQDNFHQTLENIIESRVEAPVNGKKLIDQLLRQQRFQKRLKHVFDLHYVNSLRKFHLNNMFLRHDEQPPEIKAGDFVLMKPINKFKETSVLQKLKWEIARVTDVQLGKKGHVRTIDVEYIDSKSLEKKQLFGYAVQNFAPCEINSWDAVNKLTHGYAKLPIYEA